MNIKYPQLNKYCLILKKVILTNKQYDSMLFLYECIRFISSI